MKKRILALILSMLFIFSIAGCGKADTSSDSSESAPLSTEQNASSDESSASQDNSSTDKTPSVNQTSNPSKDSSSSDKIDMESLRGKTVHLLMWRPLRDSESDKIKNFKEETGITVKITETTWTSYTSKIASMVSSGDSPDIAVIPDEQNSQGCFPLGAATIFQPVKVTKLDLTDDSFWNIAAMNNYKLKGQHYVLVAYNNFFSNAAVLFYNEDVFKEAGITTPRELWKSGKWNWDTLKSTAAALTAKGHSAFANMHDNLYMSSQGINWVSYDGNKFKSEIVSEKMIKAWTFNAEMVEAGYQLPESQRSQIKSKFIAGEVAMLTSNTWFMLKTEGLLAAKFSVDAVPAPSPAGQDMLISPAYNLFGIPKGAKQPVAAGVFLKHFLAAESAEDVKSEVINPKMEDTFRVVTGKGKIGGPDYARGIIGYTNLANLKKLEEKIGTTPSSQITSVLQQNKALVDNAVNNVNNKLGFK